MEEPAAAKQLKRDILRNEDWDKLGTLEVHRETRKSNVRDDLHELVPKRIWKSRQRALGATAEEATSLWQKAQDFWGEQYEKVEDHGSRFVRAELPIVGGTRQSASKIASGGRRMEECRPDRAQSRLVDNVSLLAGGANFGADDAGNSSEGEVGRQPAHNGSDSEGESSSDGGRHDSGLLVFIIILF